MGLSPRLRLVFARALVCMATSVWICVANAAPVAIEQMTWPEVKQAVAEGKTTIIVPVGGTEQNGPHMVLGKHNVRAQVLSQRIASLLGNALVAPVIAYAPEGNVDPPSGHMRFPGTISIPSPTFIALLEATGRSFRTAGFRDIVFIGDHGGYQRDLRTAAERLNREWKKSDVRAHAIEEYYRATETTYRDALRARGFRDDEIGTHAGVADTSLTLAVDPRLVRLDRMASVYGATSATGVNGDPRRSSADLGAIGVDAIVKATVEAIRREQRR